MDNLMIEPLGVLEAAVMRNEGHDPDQLRALVLPPIPNGTRARGPDGREVVINGYQAGMGEDGSVIFQMVFAIPPGVLKPISRLRVVDASGQERGPDLAKIFQPVKDGPPGLPTLRVIVDPAVHLA